MLKDNQQRQEATDPSQSFIVQAPAGSGKTEILTQRYLRLLGIVSAPEQIIALTFTRKAASEMRERILVALQKVAQKEQAASPHQEQTFRYAAEALRRSEQQGWQILEQTGRLKILTIDSLCQSITQAIPLQEKQIPYAEITDRPAQHYHSAARACLDHALADSDYQPALQCLLEHLDNRQDKLLQLFSDLLGTREQWLSLLYSARAQDKTDYEKMLALIEQHELCKLSQSIHSEDWQALCSLARQVANIEADRSSARFALSDWQDGDVIDRHIAAGLAALLLTGDDKLRKSLDYRVGLQRGACSDQLYTLLKATSQMLLAKLATKPQFIEALIQVKNLPSPHYDSEQWLVLQALFTLLPLLAGHLHLVFTLHNEVDFTAIAQQALFALGSEDNPTDLALYLDNSLQHLLVDEFQDTSIHQFQLLSKLVQGWQQGDGRTLFIVGDPMQSIYRFRQAEVGLFLKAKRTGIGPVQLKSLALCCNFRSTATIVNWVNQQFKTIFPADDDIELGAISFHPSVNVLEIHEDSFIKAWQFSNRQEEAKAIVQLAVDELKNHPEEQIAILVRTRGQLAEIVNLLREQHIPFQGVDIELLAKLPHLRDLWTLTQALLLPANRLVWLALLRSPFCGLTLIDLHRIANFAKKKSIYYALSQSACLKQLSEEGHSRCLFVYSVLHNALACRYQQPLVDWVAQTFKQLHGDSIFNSLQQVDLEQFWVLLERFSQSGLPIDLAQFKNEFSKLYSQCATPSRLHIMTIHKSKGLEFDCVLLPSLNAKPRTNDQPLLRWLKLPRQKQSDLFLISPIKAAYRNQCLVYDYLSKLDQEKDSYELQRLLYVAATRAKKRLYLFDSNDKEVKGTFRSLLKKQPFAVIAQEVENYSEPSPLILSKLPLKFYSHHDLKRDFQPVQPPPLSINNARQVGIIAHELLQWICDYHPAHSDDLPWLLIENRFKSLGFNKSEQQDACASLRQQINHLFNNPIGQWLSKAHQDERNEYEMLVNDQGLASTRIIDRTFIENGQRWIIDFKTGSEEEKAQQQHRQQVNQYAQLFAENFIEPIRCGLYYLTSGNWLEWVYCAKKREKRHESRTIN